MPLATVIKIIHSNKNYRRLSYLLINVIVQFILQRNKRLPDYLTVTSNYSGENHASFCSQAYNLILCLVEERYISGKNWVVKIIKC